MRTNTIAGFWPLNVVFTFWVLRAYQCHVSSYHSQVSFVPLPIVCYLSCLPFLWEEEKKKKKQARLCTLIKKTSSSLLERKRASRRAFACQPKHIFQSFRSLLHITSSLSLSWIGLFFLWNVAVFVLIFDASCNIFPSPAAHRWGRSKPAQLGSQIFMQPPLHHHKPAVTKIPNPPSLLFFGAGLN